MTIIDFRQLIPHQGGMCLLEHVLSWNQTQIVLTTSTHRRDDNPLRDNGRLRALHLCEYGAQAMAVHGALLAQAEGGSAPPGVLVSLRDVKLTVDDLSGCDQDLVVQAECLHAGQGSMQYRFVITHANDEIASGRAAVIRRPG